MLNTIAANMRTEELLKQSQALTESLQAQQEALTETNKRLEQQTRSLQKSEELLKKQQDELQKTNAELEEKAQLPREPEGGGGAEEQGGRAGQGGAGGEGRAAGPDLEVQVRVPGQHVARAPDAAQQPADPLPDPDRERRGQPHDKQVGFAQTIHSSGSDLLDLINDILDLSKIESGTMAVDVTTVPFGEVRKFVDSTFRQVADLKGLQFEVDLDPAAARDPDRHKRLQQVLKNLLSNAFKFTERGAVTLRGRRWRPAAGTPSRRCSTPPTPWSPSR